MMYLASLTEETRKKFDGYSYISTKDQLNKIVADNHQGNQVIICADFAREFFTPTGLQEYIANAKSFNSCLTIELDSETEVITKDKFLGKIGKLNTAEEFIELLVTYPKEFVETMQQLSANALEKQTELLTASNVVSGLQNIIDRITVEKESLEAALKMEQSNKLVIQSKYDALIKRINNQYNAGVDERSIFSVNTHEYDKVIYIKEVSRVQYLDSFVYYLKEILKIMYTMPTRMVVLEPYYADGKIPLYPDLVPHNQLTERDVAEGDILMLGFQPNLMKDILKNVSKISILIVVDRAGFSKPHITGKNIEYFYAVSDPKDIPAGVPDTRVISYSEQYLYIPFIEDFETLLPDERITKYSSTKIMKQFVARIEGR